MVTTKNNPTAYCLDLSRTLARVGRGPLTGIDRVELAYLSRLLDMQPPLFLIIRISQKYAILDESGARSLLDRLRQCASWGKADFASKLRRNMPDDRRRATSDVRRFAKEVCAKSALSETISRILPAGTVYLNVGHENISEVVFSAIRAVPKSRIVAMLHDTIPLDFPSFHALRTPAAFAEQLKTVQRNADTIVCVSQHTADRVASHISAFGQAPEIKVARLGVNLAKPSQAELPFDRKILGTYFVVVGTIEPRKNHALLLEIWRREFAAESAPKLVIVGQRGWRNDDVFSTLDDKPKNVLECNALSDGAAAFLLAGASALLVPSFAEGFGLPAAEAALLGVPVVCNNLPVFREILGDYPVYADVSDMYSWVEVITKAACRHKRRADTRETLRKPAKLWTWGEHFNLVLNQD